LEKNNAVIFGDSYSTFEGYIPKGYPAHYSEKGWADTDVRKVEETWWYQVVSECGFNLVFNDSWSGSTIGYTGYDSVDCSESSSFIYRFQKMCNEGFFEDNKIDTVFVFGGTNDSWSGAPIGELKFENWEKQDLYFVLPAVCYFFKLLKEKLPQADIYCLINTELNEEISAGMKTACRKYGIREIIFNNIDKRDGHPTIKGMKEIKEEVIKVLGKKGE